MNLQTMIENDTLDIDESFYFKAQKFKEHLHKWNKIHNLTGSTGEERLNYFIHDSIYPVKFLPKVDKVMDIGTGAGFPGLLLAMALPHTHFTLVEPLKKRVSFLQFVKADLKLDNVEVKRSKVENLEAEHYDLITSRAVTDTKLLLSLSEKFRDERTHLLFYKGEKVYEEVPTDLEHEVIETNKRHYLLIKGKQ